MMESQRFPQDFDGIIVGAPAYKFGPDLINYIQQAMFPVGQALNDPVLPFQGQRRQDDYEQRLGRSHSLCSGDHKML